MDFDPWDNDPEYFLDDEPAAPPPLTLTVAQRSELVTHLVQALHDRECDESLRATRRWAISAGASWARLRPQLDAHGAFCDCEVLGLLVPSP